MIEVRLFAGLRQGRQKVSQMNPENLHTVNDIMDCLGIQHQEANILRVHGFHQKPAYLLKDEAVGSLLPAVGGG